LTEKEMATVDTLVSELDDRYENLEGRELRGLLV
jgi:hypothetical protein